MYIESHPAPCTARPPLSARPGRRSKTVPLSSPNFLVSNHFFLRRGDPLETTLSYDLSIVLDIGRITDDEELQSLTPAQATASDSAKSTVLQLLRRTDKSST